MFALYMHVYIGGDFSLVIGTTTNISMQVENDSSDDSNTLYMLGSSASDSDSNQSDTEDDNNVLYQLNDSMDGSNGMEQDET